MTFTSVFVSILSVQCKLCHCFSNFFGFPGTEIARGDCIRRDGVYKYIHLSLISIELSCDPSAGHRRA